MAGNQLKNAGFLDGSTGWAGASGLTLTVDETTRGAPGRSALQAAAASITNGTTVWARPASGSRVAVTPGQVLECGGLFWGSIGTPVLNVRFFDSGGTAASATALTVQAAAPATGAALRGLETTLARAYGEVTVPAGAATAGIEVSTTMPSTTAVTLILVKPFLDIIATGVKRPQRWDPGSHANVDLQLSVWPPSLGGFLKPSKVSPIADRAGFTGDSRLPYARPVNAPLRHSLRGRLRVDPTQYDTLSEFYRTAVQPFFVVRPDTDQLCLAWWMEDGAPEPVEFRGPWSHVDVGLLLEIA